MKPAREKTYESFSIDAEQKNYKTSKKIIVIKTEKAN
jgi:hypothetical protein